MSIDSTANLLFSIGADSDDAEKNIQRFRTILNKDLSGIGAEFEQWTTKVLGDISTIQGAAIAAGALVGAGLVAVAGFAVEAAEKYSHFVDEVARGTKTTGISIENMSKLKFAADVTGTSYEALTGGLTKFASNVVKAAQGSEQQVKAFAALGITHAQIVAGEKDLNGLLLIVADRFHELGSRVLQTAEARELFGRGGADLVKMLSQGSAGLHEMGEEAAQLGLVLSGKDKEANDAYKLSIHTLKAEVEGFVVTIGRDALPLLTGLAAHVIGFAQAMHESFGKQAGWADYATLGIKPWIETFERAGVHADEFKARMEALAKSLAKYGDADRGLIDQVKGGKEEWLGLSDLLEKIKEHSEDLTSVDARQEKELEQLQFALDKTTKKYEELKAAGKLSPQDMAAQATALGEMNAAMSALMTHYIEMINRKNEEAGEDLDRQTAGQAEKSYAQKVAAWDREIQKLSEKLEKEKALTKENQDKLYALWLAGHDRLDRERDTAEAKASADLDQRMGVQREKSYAEKVAAWDREIEALGNQMQREGTLSKENQDKLYQVWLAGHDKIQAAQQAAYAAEMSKLATHLEGMLARNTTHAQQLKAQYDKDVAQFGAAEEAKAKLTATGEAGRIAIEQQFAAIRAQLLGKYTQDLQALKNSQGWRGVFGNEFAQMIRGNEALTREWASSTNQSLMMVRVTMEGLKEAGQQAFGQLAQGMGQNIASAFIYKKSIGEAMRSALASTLESLAAESITWAIYCTALGFTRLAQHDPVGAGEAFTAAAIWGSVGAAAAVAGRVIAPAQDSSSMTASAGTSSSSGTTASDSTAAAGQQQQHVTVNVWGHVFGVSGVEELTSAINDAVLNKDVQLTATNTKTGVQVTR